MKILIPALALALAAGAAQAQTAAAPATQPLGGPAIPGLCLLSREAVFANAKVGLAATARLRELAQAAEAELAADRKPVEDEAKALQAQQASLKPAELQQRQQALGQKLGAVQQKAQQRSQELELTRQKALAQIAEEAQPAVAAAYKARKCGLLVNRDAVFGGNMSGDLTAEVVKGLDATVTTITFDRATLPARTASAQPSGVQAPNTRTASARR
jgi:Skp family chaperone for outer membrane proteins